MAKRCGDNIGRAGPLIVTPSSKILPSLANLPTEMVINGVAVQGITLNARDADETAGEWTASDGEVIPEAGAGSAISYDDGSPLLADDNTSVGFNNGKCFQADDSSFLDIGTEDFVIEMVHRHKTVAFDRFLSKRNGGDEGYILYVNGSGQIVLTVKDSSANVAAIASAALTDNAWYHTLIFVDKSGSMQVYVNGKASGSAVSVSSVGDISSGVNFTVGANTALAEVYDSNMAYQGIWKQSDWLNTHLQPDTAQERFQRLVGMYPTAKGTKLWTLFDRDCPAYLQKTENGKQVLYYVGAYWPRTGQWNGSSGYHGEVEASNDFTQSEDFTNPYWTSIRSTIDSNGAIAPNKIETGDGIIGSAVDNTHYVINTNTGGSNPKNLTSIFAKAGDKQWFKFTSEALTNSFCYFDLVNGVKGTQGADIIHAYIVGPFFNDWYRISIEYDGTANHKHIWQPVVAGDGSDDDYTGDGSTVDCWVWGSQHESDSTSTYETSYMPTSGATATRLEDELYYKGDDGNLADQQGTVSFDFTAETSYLYGAALELFELNDGGASTDRIRCYIDTDGYVNVASAKTAGNAGAVQIATVVIDGTKKRIQVSYKPNKLCLFVKDYTTGKLETAEDLVVDIPENLDRIVFGQSNNIVDNLRVDPEFSRELQRAQ